VRKPKRRLTPEQRAEKKRRKQEFMTIFIRGEQKRVRRTPTINGKPIDDFIRDNADPLWYHQNEMWDEIADEDCAAQIPNKRVEPTPEKRRGSR